MKKKKIDVEVYNSPKDTSHYYSTEEIEDLITKAKECIVYPIPYGKKNKLSHYEFEILNSLEDLYAQNRIDVINEIMEILSAGIKNNKYYNIHRWLREYSRIATERELVLLFQQKKKIYMSWIESKQTSDLNVLEMAIKIARGCNKFEEYRDFRNFIVTNRYVIKGIDYCYYDPTQDWIQSLISDRVARIELTDIGVRVDEEDIVLKAEMRIIPKDEEKITLKLKNCKINEETFMFKEGKCRFSNKRYEVEKRDFDWGGSYWETIIEKDKYILEVTDEFKKGQYSDFDKEEFIINVLKDGKKIDEVQFLIEHDYYVLFKTTNEIN